MTFLQANVHSVDTILTLLLTIVNRLNRIIFMGPFPRTDQQVNNEQTVR